MNDKLPISTDFYFYSNSNFSFIATKCLNCTSEGAMEGFWGIIKKERYYGKRFTTRESLVNMIENYIDYYNNKRLQRNLGVLTPLEKHEPYMLAS